MAFVTADRVLDTSTSTGTGAIVVSGSPPNGYRTFSAVLTTSDTCYYSIEHESLNEWETGTATYSSANTLTRTTVSSSSNAGSAVNFSAGTKNVSLTLLSSKSLQTDPSGNVTPSFGGGSYTRTTFTATAGQTSFSATYTVNYVEVYLNGILLNSADYTATTGTTVVLAAAASAGDIVDVVALNISFTSGVTASGTPASGQLAAWTSATSVQGIDSFPIWQSVQTGNFTAVAGRAYPVNTTSGAVTVTLPASPTAGQIVQLTDYSGNWAINNLTVNPNGSKINGSTSNATISASRGSISLVYIDTTQGWVGYSDISTSIIGQQYAINYLTVAGGGGGGTSGGGGGAGGLLSGTFTLISKTVYPIVVGAGGSGGTGTTKAAAGSNSTFNALSAIGGGFGGDDGTLAYGGAGGSGGSGGGAGRSSSTVYSGGSGTGGQGFSGGVNSTIANYGGGGGGGANAVGGNASGSTGGAGGAGVSSLITGSAATYAGGGGSYGSAGGAGGGGAGSVSGAGTAGTANTGGGGGAAGYSGGFPVGGNGGSGVVILSVPTASYSGTTTGSPTVTTSGSNTIIKFTASGSYTA